MCFNNFIKSSKSFIKNILLILISGVNSINFSCSSMEFILFSIFIKNNKIYN